MDKALGLGRQFMENSALMASPYVALDAPILSRRNEGAPQERSKTYARVGSGRGGELESSMPGVVRWECGKAGP
jgi:hypothetical protein